SSSFSRYFFEDVRRNMTIADAFEDVTKRMRRNVIHSSQNPKLESNGNGIPNQPSDYVGVEDLYVPDNIEPLTKPIMTDLSASELEKGISVSLFSVRIPGSAVMSEVRATVIPPDFDPGKSFDGWTAFDTFGLTDPDGDRVFTGSYTKFTKSGNYSIMVDATDEHGNTADPLQITLTVEGEAPKPKLMGDVNGDNMVNIFDLVIAAGQFGQTGSGLMGDVNSDSSVNIFDLVMVAGNFGKTAAAPMLLADPISTRQLSDLARDSNPHRLQQAIIALEQQPDSQIAIQALKQILSVMQKPEKTQLLQNYPNPFNPETWIPFELAQDTGVTIEIYSFDGQLVRKLDLGYLSAGLYLSQDRAAYWDGKSDLGETVATGVYFVKFTANGHAQTRRLVILK
ncbi:MAG: T9SS type A sorting domain-containing protein, partial [Candidatus Poribacteria bacterium]|nr:T9SS type A sorting domain-containing protein [Candidatus Poribacteria bacterium]